MTITLQITEKDKFIQDYIDENNIDTNQLTIAEFFELVEDAQDLYELRKAKAEDNGVRYTMEEVAKELGFAI
ncbi:DUF6290 family protein [Streptococcus merionis]|uniref:DUF6290 family protein n=1 Tax=Streptococcus merionis TaxID=400065 RepID=UPI003516AC1B